jgi:hypothetical protein
MVREPGQERRELQLPPLEFLHFSRGAGLGEGAIRELKIGNL